MSGIGDEVLPDKQATFGVAEVLDPGNTGQDTSSFAAQHLLAVLVAPISQRGEFLTSQLVPGFLPHRPQLCPVFTDIRHLVHDDEVMLGIHMLRPLKIDMSLPVMASALRRGGPAGSRQTLKHRSATL